MTTLAVSDLWWGFASSSPSNTAPRTILGPLPVAFAISFGESSADFVLRQRHRRNRMFEAAMALASTAQRDNWDGEGSRAARLDSVERLPALLDLLPPAMEEPEISISGLGSAVLDWDRGRSFQLSIALSDKGTISFASLSQGARSHGEFVFSPERLPDEIALAFKRWIKDGACRRTAAS